MKRRDGCLNEGEIQALIDGELIGDDLEKVRRHVETCTDCAKQYNEIIVWSGMVKRAIPVVQPDETVIPVFNSQTNFPDSPVKRTILRLLPRVAALVILGVLTWLVVTDRKQTAFKPTPHDIMLWEEISGGNDANRRWHNRSITIMLTDQKGEVDIINLN